MCWLKICIASIPMGIYLLNVNNRNTRTRCEICSKLTIKTPVRRYWRRSGVFVVKFKPISHLVLVFLLLTLNRYMPTGMTTFVDFKKQPPEVLCKESCSLELRKFHRKTPVLESLFNRITGLKGCKFIKKRLQHRCFPVKFKTFLRAPILKNICKRLLLNSYRFNRNSFINS